MDFEPMNKGTDALPEPDDDAIQERMLLCEFLDNYRATVKTRTTYLADREAEDTNRMREGRW